MSPADAVRVLLEIARADALPAADTSSHWERYGRETALVETAGALEVRASGFETVRPMGARGRALAALERVSYRPAVRRIRSFGRVWPEAQRLAHDLGAAPNFNVLKSACALGVLMDHWDEYGLRPTTFTLIGDGFGFFGALARRLVPDARFYCVDLPKLLVVQAQTHAHADPAASTSVLSAGQHADGQIVYVLPSDVERITSSIDCAVNIASMQEMTHQSIAAYFAFLRRRSHATSSFYCINRESKTLPDGSTIRFAEYPWSHNDDVFIDGPCPYYTHYLSRRTAVQGPRVLGIRVPFINGFDGRHMHRHVRLARA